MSSKLNETDKELLIGNEPFDYNKVENSYFGGYFGNNSEDYVEVMIHDTNDNLLETAVADSSDYYYDSQKGGMKLKTGTILRKLGYDRGRFKVTYNFLRKLAGSYQTVVTDQTGNIFNGDVDIAGDLTFSSAARDIKLLDNTASALDITEASNSYMSFTTSNGTEKITTSKATIGTIYDNGSSPGASIAFDFANGNNQKVTLSANFALAEPTNQVAGQSGSIFFIQPGGANYSISSIHADWLWPGGTDGVLTATNGAVDRLDYIILADNSVHAVMSQAMAA